MKMVKKAINFDKKTLRTGEMFGIPIFGRDVNSLLALLDNNHSDKPVWIATINPEFVMNALKDAPFFNLLVNRTSVNVLDGVGLVWGRKVMSVPKWYRLVKGFEVGVNILKGGYRDEMITGVELIDQLCSKAVRENRSIYFFGGWGDRASRTASFFKNKYPGLKVSGAEAEGFDFETKADYLFVARGMKKQEIWIDQNLSKLKVKVVVGVGRSFDYYSGDLKRAPAWVRRSGFEWLYSLFKEPARWRRQIQLPLFIWKVLTSS